MFLAPEDDLLKRWKRLKPAILSEGIGKSEIRALKNKSHLNFGCD
jgi:hypothetical protein